MSLNARVAAAADLDTVTEVMTLAFAEDPVWGHSLRKPGGPPEEMADFWRLWILGAFRYPWVCLWNEGEAASLWIPPGGTEMSADQEKEFDMLATSRLGHDGAAYLAQVMALFDANHPHGEPHYYLSLLATHPAHRGHGVGIALLADPSEQRRGQRDQRERSRDGDVPRDDPHPFPQAEVVVVGRRVGDRDQPSGEL